MTAYPDLSADGFSSNVVLPSGSGSLGITVIGEAPGADEDKHGVPFYPKAAAGSMLERLLKRAGMSRDTLRITNCCWQRPPNNWLDGAPWEARAIEAWKPTLQRELEETKPRVILALGNVALRTLTSYGGRGSTISNVHGYVLASHLTDAWVIPLYHPSYLVQGGHALCGAFIWGLHRAEEIAEQGFQRKPTRLVLDNADGMREFVRGYDPARHVLSYDIETPDSSKLDEEQLEDEDDPSYTILRISFCYDAETGYAISVPWQPPFIEMAKVLLASSGAKRVWNAGFDNPRLRGAGCEINGPNHDCMEGWSMLQRSLPRALAFVAPLYGWHDEPWKHESLAQPAYYSACDALALQLCGDGIERDLRAQDKWELYERHVRQTYEVLTLMSRNGLPYSQEEAQRFREKLKVMYDERAATLQQRIPEALKPSKQKQGLKRTPKDTTGLVQRKFTVLGSDLTEIELTAMFPDVSMAPSPFDVVEVTRWCLLEPFLPTSPQQVLTLVKHYGHKPGRNRKTKRDTTDEDTLKKLYVRLRNTKKGEEASVTYKLIIECRQLSKVLGTYVDGWKPGKDGRIHATPGFWGKMYRVSWRRPNIAATIADKDEEYIAAGFRKCVQAREGHVLIEADWKGMEAYLVGWFAEDPAYMRLSALGVHSYMMALVLADQKRILPADVPELSWSDEDIKAALSPLKKRYRFEYDQNKHGTHLSNYLGTPRLMVAMFPESFPNERAARWWQDFYFSTVASKVRAWQERTLQQAHREAKLTNPFGYTMWFWDVLRWDAKKQKEQFGEDAKSAVAFLPRDTGAAMLKEALLRLRPLAEEGVLLGTAHDAMLGEALATRAEEVAWQMKYAMEHPVRQLNGAHIGVDVKIGKAWDDESMELVTLPAFASIPPVLCSVNAS